MKKQIVRWISITIGALFLVALVLYLRPVPAKTSVEEIKKQYPNLLIEETRDQITVKKRGSTDLIVFYPGAKIEASAYLPLSAALAEDGIDVTILKFPLNLALLDKHALDRVDRDGYSRVVLMGHSLGGVVAAESANENDVSGLILLASYPNVDLKEKDMPMLSIFGNRDGVLNKEKYESSKVKWPKMSEEVIIEGANHAGFGNYGDQNGDMNALIIPESQIEQTRRAVEKFIHDLS